MTVAKNKRFKAKESIPNFKSREEMAEFWDTHDVTDYLHELKPVQVTVAEGLLSVLQVQFDAETSAELFLLADAQGVLPGAMVEAWVKERVEKEKGVKNEGYARKKTRTP